MSTTQPTPPAAPSPATQAPATAPATTTAPTTPLSTQPVYPILKYRPIAGYPGFTYQKVNSAEEEAALMNPSGDAATLAGEIQWYNTPGEAQLARSAAHRPFEEFGQEILAPIGVPVPLRPQFAAQFAGALPDTPGAAPAAEEAIYPLLKYQAIDEPPGFKYVKMMSPADETTLEASNAGIWYDTPAEAIANPPAPPPEPKNALGVRPVQTSLGSAPGPAVPENAGGSDAPQPQAQQAKADPRENGKKKPPNGGRR
jgi:hypothetical protein